MSDMPLYLLGRDQGVQDAVIISPGVLLVHKAVHKTRKLIGENGIVLGSVLCRLLALEGQSHPMEDCRGRLTPQYRDL